MNTQVKDKSYSIITVLVVSLIIYTPIYLVTLQIGMSNQYILLFYLFATLLVMYIFIFNLEKALLLGYRKRHISQELFGWLQSLAKSSGLIEGRRTCDFILVDDASYVAFVLLGWSKYTVVLSNTITSELSHIELETVFSYLDELTRHTLLRRDSIVLLLATWMQRLIISSLVGAALVQIVRNPHLTEELDEKVANRDNNAIGYKTILEKFKSKSEVMSILPSAVGMNAIANVKNKNTSMFPSLYFTHPSLEKRILTMMKIHDQERLI